jgi:hypothetical protein
MRAVVVGGGPQDSRRPTASNSSPKLTTVQTTTPTKEAGIKLGAAPGR